MLTAWSALFYYIYLHSTKDKITDFKIEVRNPQKQAERFALKA